MGEAWIPVAYALIAALAAGFSAWIGSKKAVAPVAEKLDGVKKDLDGRLTEWRAETEKYVRTAVAAALAEGKVIGAEQEKRSGVVAERILEKAELVAEKVVDVAKGVAAEVLTVAEKK